jgi:long-chain acyl-CoA synthetase
MVTKREGARLSSMQHDAPPYRTLVGLVEWAAGRYGERPALSLRHDDGRISAWSYAELRRRMRLAAWRLLQLGLAPGDRILTWAPSTQALPAAYFGAMRARLVIVPLDTRMSADAIERIVERSGARHLILGSGRDAPDPRDVRLERFPTTILEDLTAEPDDSFPSDWEDQLGASPEPDPSDIFELIFTSGTTGTPKGVMLAHDNVLAGVETFHRIVPPMEHRVVSLLPLSHLFEQAVALFYAISVGADILYVRSLNPRVIFDSFRQHRVTSLVVTPAVLDLFWSAIEREAERSGRAAMFARLRRIARHLPMGLRRRLFRSVHERIGGGLRIFVSAGAFLPPSLQQAWEDLGVIVIQGYGATETGTGCCTTLEDHGLGTVGRAPAGVEVRIAPDGEVQFRGQTLFKGYWQDPEATAAAFTEDGWYRSGDLGHLDPEGRLILQGRKKDMIVLPNGFNVFPEDIENELRMQGIRESVVLETSPGRIEAIVLPPGTHPVPGAAGASVSGDADPEVTRQAIDAAVKAANARLGAAQRVQGWRLWPDADFPRTHTLKVKRDLVRAWAVIDAPLPVRQGA